ncbi:hypothetical protein AURDEDRAFT_109611 [Auricularia subglabra TFB-10046 SS5]|nr:hypothetical protein AURDEDRAFT_109611 [Auricularia subglabra TFB-10046 SS5]
MDHRYADASTPSLPLHRRRSVVAQPPHRRPNHLAHHRSYSQPVPARPSASHSHDMLTLPPTDAAHGSLLSNVRRGFRKGSKGSASDSEHDFAFPLSSIPPPTIPEIMMGLHLSRTPHLPQAHPKPAPGPPPVVRNEENSPAPPFLFALLRARAEAAAPPPQHRVYRRSTIHTGSPSSSQSQSPPGTARPRVPLPPPPKRSSLKKTSTNSSDSSIPTTPGTSGSPNGRGTPSPSISSISSSRHELRTPSKLRFSTLFRPAHRKDAPPPAPAPPPPPLPKKAVRFSPSYGGLSTAATAGGFASSPDVSSSVAVAHHSDSQPASSTPVPSVPSSGTRRAQFVRRVSGRAKEAAKDVFAVITDPRRL